MIDRERIIDAFYLCKVEDGCSTACPYWHENAPMGCTKRLADDVYSVLKEQKKEIKALQLLVDWAEECGFGFNQFPNDYEQYKNEIKDMKYIDGMIHIAKRVLENHKRFEEE